MRSVQLEKAKYGSRRVWPGCISVGRCKRLKQTHNYLVCIPSCRIPLDMYIYNRYIYIYIYDLWICHILYPSLNTYATHESFVVLAFKRTTNPTSRFTRFAMSSPKSPQGGDFENANGTGVLSKFRRCRIGISNTSFQGSVVGFPCSFISIYL